jgi:uncharacterized membrane protein (DUF4010 family)
MIEQTLLQLLVAGATGLVIGIERGWSARGQEGGQRAAGMRTFSLAGLAGGLCALLPDGIVVLAVLLLAVAALVTVTHFLNATRDGDRGLTTEVALLVAVLLGAFATTNPRDAIAVAALIAALLGFKQELHGVVERLGRHELLASVQLLVVAVVILPLLPDEGMGPWSSINPRTIGILVLVLLGISYVGYFAVRIIGPRRGLLLTALLGGFTSSTAVTLAYARMARRSAAATPLLAAGITLASAMMALRVWLVVTAIRPGLSQALAAPLVVLGLLPFLFAAGTALRHRKAAAEPAMELHNPLEIQAALVLAAGITVLTLVIRAAEEWLGNPGAYAVAALSGVLDVDAVSVAMAQGGMAGIPPGVAVNGILIAVIVNTLAKTTMTGIVGSIGLALRVGSVLVPAAAVAGILGFLA